MAAKRIIFDATDKLSNGLPEHCWDCPFIGLEYSECSDEEILFCRFTRALVGTCDTLDYYRMREGLEPESCDPYITTIKIKTCPLKEE